MLLDSPFLNHAAHSILANDLVYQQHMRTRISSYTVCKNAGQVAERLSSRRSKNDSTEASKSSYLRTVPHRTHRVLESSVYHESDTRERTARPIKTLFLNCKTLPLATALPSLLPLPVFTYTPANELPRNRVNTAKERRTTNVSITFSHHTHHGTYRYRTKHALPTYQLIISLGRSIPVIHPSYKYNQSSLSRRLSKNHSSLISFFSSLLSLSCRLGYRHGGWASM